MCGSACFAPQESDAWAARAGAEAAIALVVEIASAVRGSITRPGERTVGSRRRLRNRVDRDRVGSEVSLGPLSGHVGFVLRRIQTAVFADFIASLGQLDLRPAQYALLEVIDANPGLRQSDAAAALGIQKANFVALVRELERRALLQRRRSQADRR